MKRLEALLRRQTDRVTAMRFASFHFSFILEPNMN